jgi:hypothetical protein
MGRILTLPLLFLLPIIGAAQQSSLRPAPAGDKLIPVVKFELVLPGVVPPRYSIEVESNGKALYYCDELDGAQTEAASTGETYTENLIISTATAKRIFELAQQANYFHGDFNYSKGHIANTGTKTLTYFESPEDSLGKPVAGQRVQTTYNYSENPFIQQLTTIFDNISNTVELGRTLRHSHRFDKLGLDAVLKNAEEMAQTHRLLELQLISATLRDLADDSSLLHIVRQRAQRLLKLAETETGQ